MMVALTRGRIRIWMQTIMASIGCEKVTRDWVSVDLYVRRTWRLTPWLFFLPPPRPFPRGGFEFETFR